MKIRLGYLLTVSSLLLLSACGDDAAEPIPVAPILKEIVMPSIDNVMPGKSVVISGKGFDKNDIIRCISLSGESDFVAEVVGADNYGITIIIPSTAAGSYEVQVERSNLTTTLAAQLKVPYLVVIENLDFPTGIYAHGQTVEIGGSGFENGDIVELSSDGYPSDFKFTQSLTLTKKGASFIVPETAYGVNNVVIKRDNKQNTLGSVSVSVNVGDEIGGGIVYYVSDNGIHGLIGMRENVGTATQQWGPGVALSLSANTAASIYSGKANTQSCVNKMQDFRKIYSDWNSKKSAAELCSEATLVENGVTYDDWFLPSQEELIELFKVKSIFATKGYAVSANNYWTSTEADGNDAGWAAYYVNFYEETTIVSAIADKSVWMIGVRPIRQF